jgi:hypothetical protein
MFSLAAGNKPFPDALPAVQGAIGVGHVDAVVAQIHSDVGQKMVPNGGSQQQADSHYL